MKFTNPQLFFASLLITIPVIIHLLTRRKPKIIKFAAISLVIESDKKMASRLKIRNLLLLLVRSLILSLLVAAALGIYINSSSKENSFSKIYVLLDLSYSMNRNVSGSTLWEESLKEFRDLIKNESDETQFFIYSEPETIDFKQSMGLNKDKVEKYIQKLSPGVKKGDMPSAVNKIITGMHQNENEDSLFIIISDMTVGSWNRISEIKQIMQDVNIVFINVLDKEQAVKRSAGITKVKVIQGLELDTLELDFELKNWSNDSIETKVYIKSECSNPFNDSMKIVLSPQGITRSTYRFSLSEKGFICGYLQIDDKNLEIDNTRYFSFYRGGLGRVLVINGDPRLVDYTDEAFYIMNVLATDSKVIPTKIRLRDLTSVKLESFDLILLLNPGKLDTNSIMQLSSYYFSGGALFISLGSMTNLLSMNKLLSKITEIQLKEVVKPTENKGLLTIQDLEHPIFDPFIKQIEAGFENVRFKKYYKLDYPLNFNGKTLLNYLDHLIMIEENNSTGRFILYTSTVDRDWTNWPIKTSFMPLLQRIIFYLTGRLEMMKLHKYKPGDLVNFGGKDSRGDHIIINPNNEKIKLKGSIYENTLLPGFYKSYLATSGGDLPFYHNNFVVNVDSEEANPAQIKLNSKVNKSFKNKSFLKNETDLSSLFLFIVILMVFIESILIL